MISQNSNMAMKIFADNHPSLPKKFIEFEVGTHDDLAKFQHLTDKMREILK